MAQEFSSPFFPATGEGRSERRILPW
jgi:hypothetical protein